MQPERSIDARSTRRENTMDTITYRRDIPSDSQSRTTTDSSTQYEAEKDSIDLAAGRYAPSVRVTTRPGSPTGSLKPGDMGLAYTRLQFTLLFMGLVLSVLLTSSPYLSPVVAVAIPAIVTDFQTFSGLSWIGTAFFLASIPLIPTYGKLADVFGRKPVFMTGIVIFEIGSLICGLSQSMLMLIAGRAVAGLGAGCIFPMTLIIVSDIVPLRDRPKYQGIISACFGLSSVAGPLLGGSLTDHISWRWCFFINLPVGALAILCVFFFLQLPATSGNMKEKLARVDYIGTLWLAAGTVMLVYALSTGGDQYDWISVPVLVTIGGSVACFVVFALVEVYVVKVPLIPFDLYKNRFVLAGWLCAFFVGFCFFSLSYYVPVYFQVVYGLSATKAGLQTIPLVVTVTVMSVICGILISATGLTAPFVHVGSALVATGAGLISTLNATSGVEKQVGYLLIAGMGVGVSLQGINVNVQSSVKPELVAMAIAGWSFSQFTGAVFGISVNGAIFSNTLTARLSNFKASDSLLEFVRNNPSKIHSAVESGVIPRYMLDPIIDAYTDALAMVFRSAAVAAGVWFLVSFFLRRQKLQAKGEVAKGTVLKKGDTIA
ncbi:MFS general substrate transporter [Gonapodya prolifera JEL478]|uniref:MFS general substrate transporter n=1 Tax=Gonapodya prolifera (strain JEL478) TaxID=1344416 RepID=A0A138ZZG6_GONPJ|nr:MFS general substrate transporter [Gonapodya prolifera JEL478]|eukprot:KXS09808.1 MFS general substrate transporter [Gonapodya prolifera JEL478]